MILCRLACRGSTAVTDGWHGRLAPPTGRRWPRGQHEGLCSQWGSTEDEPNGTNGGLAFPSISVDGRNLRCPDVAAELSSDPKPGRAALGDREASRSRSGTFLRF
jgi:hypothetical protein